jgi:simple sugar transport system permease protein
MGVPVDRIKILIYALSGFCAASAGIVVTFYMQAGNSSSFVGLEMDAIAAAVIGGTLLTGGVGWISGTLMGVLILGVIKTLITFQGTLNNWWAKIFTGILLFLFIAIQQLLNRRLKGR